MVPEPMTVGPERQYRLLPIARAEEREEDEIRESKPLKNRFSLLAERGERRDEDKPYNTANGDLRRENRPPVPRSSPLANILIHASNVQIGESETVQRAGRCIPEL